MNHNCSTREQKIAKARKLREADVSNVEIGRRLGISTGTIHGWLRAVPYPDRVCRVCGSSFIPQMGNQRICCGENARKRHHERGRRGHCVDCSSDLSAGTGYPGSRVNRCATCERRRRAELRDKRAQRIEVWWAEGLSLKEIATQLGWSISHIGVEMVDLRAKGYQLPYRNKAGRKKAAEKLRLELTKPCAEAAQAERQRVREALLSEPAIRALDGVLGAVYNEDELPAIPDYREALEAALDTLEDPDV